MYVRAVYYLYVFISVLYLRLLYILLIFLSLLESSGFRKNHFIVFSFFPTFVGFFQFNRIFFYFYLTKSINNFPQGERYVMM